MSVLRFKTNINCQNCINSISPHLNQELDIERWVVNTDHPEKLLEVEGDLNAEEIIQIIEKAGFKAEID